MKRKNDKKENELNNKKKNNKRRNLISNLILYLSNYCQHCLKLKRQYDRAIKFKCR